jgi:hypothetical protein
MAGSEKLWSKGWQTRFLGPFHWTNIISQAAVSVGTFLRDEENDSLNYEAGFNGLRVNLPDFEAGPQTSLWWGEQLELLFTKLHHRPDGLILVQNSPKRTCA